MKTTLSTATAAARLAIAAYKANGVTADVLYDAYDAMQKLRRFADADQALINEVAEIASMGDADTL